MPFLLHLIKTRQEFGDIAQVDLFRRCKVMTRVDANNDAEAEALLAKMPDLSPLIADAGNGGSLSLSRRSISRVFPKAHLQCVSHWCEDRQRASNSDG